MTMECDSIERPLLWRVRVGTGLGLGLGRRSDFSIIAVIIMKKRIRMCGFMFSPHDRRPSAYSPTANSTVCLIAVRHVGVIPPTDELNLRAIIVLGRCMQMQSFFSVFFLVREYIRASQLLLLLDECSRSLAKNCRVVYVKASGRREFKGTHTINSFSLRIRCLFVVFPAALFFFSFNFDKSNAKSHTHAAKMH